MGRKKEGMLGQRLPLDNDEEEGGFLKTRHLRGAWGVFLWYHLGTIWVPSGYHLGTIWVPSGYHLGTIWVPSGYHPGTMPPPCPHNANTVPVRGVQDTRKQVEIAGFWR